MQGKCLTDNLVYQATVKCDDSEHTYVGLASTTFKLRFGNHKKSSNHERYRKETSLSDFIWELVKQGKNYKLEWKQIGRAQPFSPISGECNLCTLEKFHLLFTPYWPLLTKKKKSTITVYTNFQCYWTRPKSLGILDYLLNLIFNYVCS